MYRVSKEPLGPLGQVQAAARVTRAPLAAAAGAHLEAPLLGGRQAQRPRLVLLCQLGRRALLRRRQLADQLLLALRGGGGLAVGRRLALALCVGAGRLQALLPHPASAGAGGE